MKKITAFCLLFLGVSSVAVAQENKETKPERVKVYKVETTSTTTTTEPTQRFASAEEEIAFCENQLKALDEKEKWIRQNPAEVQTAEETGWFDMANEQRKTLNARIAELKNQSK